MLATLDALRGVVFLFLRQQWMPLLCAIFVVGAYFWGRYRRKNAVIAGTKQDLLSRRDMILVEAAIARLEGDSLQNNRDYVQLIGFRLEHLVNESRKAEMIATRLGVTALTASAMSSFITGSGVFGDITVAASFTVTSIGAVCLSLNTFIAAEPRFLNYLILAERIRLELTQFVGASSEYAYLDIKTAYNRFAGEIDHILGDQIAQHIAAAASKATADKGNKEQGED